MNIRRKWTLYYLAAFLLETCIFGLFAHHIKPTESLEYSFFLGGLLCLIVLLPFYIVTWLGTANSQMNIKRAVGTGFLVWSLILAAHVVIGIFPDARLLMYLFDVLIGFFLLWYFKFPNTFGILPVIFPGISLLYLLIYGHIRVKK